MSTFVVNMSKNLLQDLRDSIEQVMGHSLSVRSDFDELVSKLEENLHERLSSTTLRRFWGYQDDQQAHISMSSLNILARFCGYSDFAFFAESHDSDVIEGDQSHFSHSECVSLDDVEIGDTLCLMWNPGRVVTVRYDGQDNFTVLTSINSKLVVGTQFTCSVFIEGEPLLFTNLTLDSKVLGHYICGKRDGVRITVIKKRS